MAQAVSPDSFPAGNRTLIVLKLNSREETHPRRHCSRRLTGSFMNPKHIREIQTNDVLQKRLAKYIALHCFRNTAVLENLHSGKAPISESGDYADVRVLTPDMEIPWRELSRFDNNEMKALMIDAVNHCYQLLTILFSSPVGDKVIEELVKRDLVPGWNDPDSAWKTDHEPLNVRDSARKGLATGRKLKRRKRDKVPRRSRGKK